MATISITDAGLRALQPQLSLSDQAYYQIRECIIDGRFAPSSRLAEAALARQLGVSRTPLHQAMVTLASEGLVESLGRKGWLVSPLNEIAAGELYAVLGSTEALALQTMGHLALCVVEQLRELSVQPSDRSIEGVWRLQNERRWHQLVLGQCPNHTLVALVHSLLTRGLRYEMACVHRSTAPLPSVLGSIERRLLDRNVIDASRLIEIHWRDRGQYVTRVLGGMARKRTGS